MIKTETKISLPLYKLAYAFSFVVILSLIRGITYSYEIGIALEPPMAALAVVFCADTYTQELSSGRFQIHRLYPMKKRLRSIGIRMLLQEMVLFLLSAIGYGMFYGFWHPLTLSTDGQNTGSQLEMFFICLAAMAVTLWFWGLLSNLLSCLFRNMWISIGCCVLLWLLTNSLSGKKLFGKWNLFSYTFRNITNGQDLSWLCGKLLCLFLCLFMALLLPTILKKRG